MSKSLSIAIAMLLILSILGIALPIMTAHAGTLGTLTVSSSQFSGNAVIQVTVTDSDIASVSVPVGMPSVTASSATGGTVTVKMFQSVGGSWFGFVGVGASRIVPANPPMQDPLLGPGEIAWTGIQADVTDAGAGAGETITIVYNDVDPPASVSVTLNKASASIAPVTATTAIVSLDKSAHSPWEQVTMTVNDTDMNLDSTKPDTISTDAGINLAYLKTTSNTAGIPITLTETGPDTGIFNATKTLGTDIAATVGDEIIFEYNDLADAAGQRNTLVVATATVMCTDGTVSFDKSSYLMTDMAIITLKDPDLNRNPSAPETYTTASAYPGGGLIVTTPTDLIGLVIPVSETGLNTGVFTATVTFTSATSAGTTLKTTDGGTLTALYTDWTPSGSTAATLGIVTKDVTASAIVSYLGTISATATEDSTGAVKTNFTAGETVIPAATIMNKVAISKGCLIAIQVMAPDGTAYPTLYSLTTLTAGKEFTFMPSFILPSDAQTGTWSFEVNVFSTFPAQGGTAQANPVTGTFTVE